MKSLHSVRAFFRIKAMPLGKHELSISRNQCLLLDWRFELDYIKIPFWRAFQLMNLQIIQPPLNGIHTKTYSFFCWWNSVFALTLTYRCTHLAVVLAQLSGPPCFLEALALRFGWWVCFPWMSVAYWAFSWNRAPLGHLPNLHLLFSSLVSRSSPVWFRVAIAWGGIKSAANCEEGRQTLRPPASLLTMLASPSATWGCGQRGREWHGRHSRRQALGHCNTCFSGSLWWEENGFQSISLLILQIS